LILVPELNKSMKRYYYTLLLILSLFTAYPYPVIEPDTEYRQFLLYFSKLTLHMYWSVYEVSTKYSISPVILLSIIKEESDFDMYAVSKAGAKGLMQVMPIHNIYNKDLFDPYVNIDLGTKYFLICYKLAKGNYNEALRMYNAGIFSDRSKYKNWKYVSLICKHISSNINYQYNCRRIQ